MRRIAPTTILVLLAPLAAAAQLPGLQKQQQQLPPGVTSVAPIVPKSGSGVLAGSFTASGVRASSYDWFKGFGYSDDVCVPNYLTGGCLYEHTYGAVVNWVFDVTGDVRYEFSAPYTVAFSLSTTEVFPGQRLYLRPTFTWGVESPQFRMTATQHYSYSHVTETWGDCPFDGMDDVYSRFTQYGDRANIGVGLPVLPGFDSIKGDWDARFAPFNEGGGNYGGSYTKLGGTGKLVTGGSIPMNVSADAVCIRAEGTSAAAWKQGHEQFELASYVLHAIPTPPTEIAGAALDLARGIGGFKLFTQLDGSIFRSDYVCLEVAELPFVDVPAEAGSHWTFTNVPVTVRYRVYGVSTFGFPFGYTVSFKMNGIDPKVILHSDPLLVPAGGGWSPWQQMTATFPISGRLAVKPKQAFRPELATTASSPLATAARSASKQQLIRFDPKNLKIATPELTRTVVRAKRQVGIPRSTAERGLPQPGEYTVVLGAAAAPKANQIVALLKQKGISAYAVSTPQATQLVVTLGVYDRAQAATLAGMLREILKLDGDVVQSITQTKLRPLGDETIAKLTARR